MRSDSHRQTKIFFFSDRKTTFEFSTEEKQKILFLAVGIRAESSKEFFDI